MSAPTGGGNGGAGGDVAASGSAGSNPGGGGGGGGNYATTGNAGGAGAHGKVVISYTIPDFISISGTCKQADKTTNCTDVGTIKYAINDTIQAETQETVAGTWTISGIIEPSNGDIITVFIDGAGEADEAVGVTKYDGDGDITGIELIAQSLSIGSDDNATITNDDLAQFDNSVSGDEDIFHEVDSSNNLVINDSGKSSASIFIKENNTFRPDSTNSGNVTTKNLYINDGASFTADGNTITLTGGDTPLFFVYPGSSVNFGTSTFVYNSNENVSLRNQFQYYNLILAPTSSGTPTYTISSPTFPLRVNNFTIGDGTNPVTFDWSSINASIEVKGNLTLLANTTWIKSDTASLTFNGTTTPVSLTDNNSTKQDLGAVVIDGSKEVDLGSSVTVTRMNVTSDDTLDLQSSGYTLKITGSGTGVSRPFINNGTLSIGTNSIIEYVGTTETEVQAGSYSHLTLNQSGTTFITSGNLTIFVSLTIQAGTFNAGSGLILLQGTTNPLVINGTLEASTSTFRYHNYANISVLAVDYYNLEVGTFIGLANHTYTVTSGTLNVLNNLTIGSTVISTITLDVNTNDPEVIVGGDFLIQQYGAYSASSNEAYPLRVVGNLSNNGTFTHNSGKVILNGAIDSFQSILGSSTINFYSLEIETGDREIVFGTSNIKEIDTGGSLVFTGTNCENMTRVRSTTSGVQATLEVDISATATVSHLDLQDLNLTGKAITAANSVDSGNNSGYWTIDPNACIGTSTNQATTGYAFQRKVIYDDVNNIYWSFNHDGDEIEIKYSDDEGAVWNNPATPSSARLPYNTNDFSVWWGDIDETQYIVLAVSDGGDIKVRQGVLSETDISWDTDVSVVLDETDNYSKPYITFDSSNKMWVGATYNDDSDYVFKTVVSDQSVNTDVSTWTWTTTPYQLSDDQTSSNVYGTLSSLSDDDMYATFVVDTELLGCRWVDIDSTWVDTSGDPCISISGDDNNENTYFDSLNEGLIGYWKMNEASWNGTTDEVIDSSEMENHGTRGGNATTVSSGFGRSGTFDQFDDYVNIPDNSSLDITEDFSISAWINPQGGSTRSIVSKRQAAGGSGYALVLGGSNEIYCQTENAGFQSSYTATSAAPNDVWTHVVIARSGTSCHVYINGVDATSSAASHSDPFTNNFDLRIGTATDTSEDYNGKVDEVRLYNRAISTEEISKILEYVPESVNIDDASDFDTLLGAGRQMVRTKAGVLYTFLNNGGSCELWKSSDGVSWSEVDSMYG